MKLFQAACLLVLSITMLQGISADCNIPGAPAPLKKGETFSPVGECVKYTCEGSSFAETGCPAMRPKKGCKMSGEDLTKPFPNCCPKSIC